LAARSCLEAADALVECGRKMEATVLYHEVINRYRNTAFARDAQATLKAGLKRAAETQP
jgi:TolA-binding protein